MLTRDVILTEYRADARNFQRTAKIYDQTLEKQHRVTRDRLGRVDARWQRSTRSILATRTALGGLTGFVGGAAIIQLRNYAEEWRNVERRLRSIGVTGEAAQQSLVDLAIRTRSSVGSTASAVQRLAKSTGAGIEITTRRVETLQKLLAAGGASGSERASVSLQLGQALQSGVLSGDEFRSIRETAPVEFLDALAKAAGITRAELKGFAESQRLTSAIVLEALDGLASTADASFSQMAISGGEAFTVLTAGLTAYAGRVDESLGATAAINGATASLGEYMAGVGEGAETMAAAIKVVGAVALATAGSRGLGALTRSFRSAAEARRENVTVARIESRAAQQAVTDAGQELAAKRALRAEREIEHRRRVSNNLASVKSAQQLRAAINAEEKTAARLSGAQARATATSAALTAAQRNLSVAARATAASLRLVNGVMAFFGGPVGLAITGMVGLVAVMQQMKTPTERLDAAFGALSTTLSKMEGVNTSLASDYAALKRAQDSLAEATRLGGQAAVDAATLEMDSINRRIAANETLRRELAVLAKFELAAAQAQQRAANEPIRREMARRQGGIRRERLLDRRAAGYSTEEVDSFTAEILAGLEAAEAANIELDQKQRDVLKLIKDASEARVEVLNLEARLAALSAPADVTETPLQLSEDADAARANIAALIAAIPELRAAEKVQADLAAARANRDAALAAANALPSDKKESEIARINDLYRQAAAEIDGTAKSIRDAKTAFDAFTDQAHLDSLSAQEQAIVRQTRAYETLREQLEATGADRERLAEAEAAHRQSLANIKEQFDTRDGSAAERDLAAARALLVENGQKALYIEQELNAERERLRALLPSLIEMGLSRAEAEAVLNSRLERTEDRLTRIRTAAEEAAHAFAKGVLQDIRAAEDLNDALDNISQRLLDLAFDQAFDMLAQQFARIGSGTGQGGGIGGFLGNIFAGVFGGGVQAATGGLVLGPGTSTSDSIPARLSNGEFVIQAASVTPQTLPMLEAINRGAVVPKFAGGGQVGRTISSASQGALVNIAIHNHASQASVEARPSRDGRGLDVVIHDVVNNGIIGGKYNSTMRQQFSLRPGAKGA